MNTAGLTSGVGIDWLRYGLSIAVVLILLIGLLWILKRLKSMHGISNGEKQLRIVETINIGARQKISLIQVGSRHVLVGISANQFTSLATWSNVDLIKGDDIAA